MNDPLGCVFIIDDDPSVLKSLSRLVRSTGLSTECFESPTQFLEFQRPDVPSCVVLDLQLPELSGLQVQKKLLEAESRVPIVFISGQGDIPRSVEAMKAGAVDFLTKPFEEDGLLSAIRRGLESDRVDRRTRSSHKAVRERFHLLSHREREVMSYVVGGHPNKLIGKRLGITEKTIKAHRAQVMRKMQATSLADLVRMADKLGISVPSNLGFAGSGMR